MTLGVADSNPKSCTRIASITYAPMGLSLLRINANVKRAQPILKVSQALVDLPQSLVHRLFMVAHVSFKVE